MTNEEFTIWQINLMKRRRRNQYILVFSIITFLMTYAFIHSSFQNKDVAPERNYEASFNAGYCIKKETWGAFSEEDFDKMIKYSVNQELVLLQKMIDQNRVIKLKKGIKVILDDVGFLTTIIRLPNNEDKIWIVSEAVGGC